MFLGGENPSSCMRWKKGGIVFQIIHQDSWTPGPPVPGVLSMNLRNLSLRNFHIPIDIAVHPEADTIS